MMTLLDEDERLLQDSLPRVPAPLGPSTAPIERRLTYGRERLKFVQSHRKLRTTGDREPRTRCASIAGLHRRHIRVLLESACTAGGVLAETAALFAPLCDDVVAHELNHRIQSLESLATEWEIVALKPSER